MNATLQDLLLNDRGFAFEPSSGQTCQLSSTGLRIVRLLQDGADEPVVVDRLLKEYQVDEHTVRRDVQTFLGSLKDMGWL
jgi:hypothetical protein